MMWRCSHRAWESQCWKPCARVSKHDTLTRCVDRYFFINSCCQTINQVIQHLGLVIALYDILSSEGDFIYPCEGAVRYKVRFQVIVFRPYINEVFNGTLKAATRWGTRTTYTTVVQQYISCRDGLFVSLGFFDDVFVPSSAMPSSTLYKEDEAQWIWVYDDPEEGRVELYYDVGQPIRVKVTGVRFSPVPPPPELQPDAAEGKVGTRERPYQPMVVEASVLEDGLGLCVWWLEDAGGD